MSYQILSTKLYVPSVQSSLVHRTRLIEHLENDCRVGKRVTLVSAPAGFGKTTIIRQWIAASNPKKPFGWLSLDDGDNDPNRFLIYLVSAIQKVNEKIGLSVQASLQSSQVPPLMGLAEALINDIAFETEPFLIVLDDYHLIKNPEVHSLMQFFLKQQPDALHLVIITREDPPLPLPRMRVQGTLAEIRERDLRFTLAEAQAFLRNTMGLALSPEDIGKLEERTEGWAAGMQLAALALEEVSDANERHAFIEAFTGDNRLIFDYLISEVLQRQPEATRRFLLRTAILERFCAGLCDQVVFDGEGAGSQPILEALEKANMFLVPLDNQRRWYRYHHLFSEMLRHSLQHASPGLIPALHASASQWFEVKGFIPEAVKHALASRDWELVRALLDRYALSITFPGYGWMVIDWCRQLPKSFLEQAPDICIHFAWALVLTFREDYMDKVDEYLQLAEQGIQKDDLPEFAPVGEGRAIVPFKRWVQGHISVIRSQILLGHLFKYIDPQKEIALSRKGLELLPESELISRSICRINLAHAQTMQNNPIEAQKAFEEVMAPSLESKNFLSAVAASFYMARMAFYMQNVDQGEKVCQHWKKTIEDAAIVPGQDRQPIEEVPALRGMDIVQGIILLERNQVDEAERVFIQALDMLGWGSWMELHGFYELLRSRFLRGDLDGVQEILRRMSRQGPQHVACAEALQTLFDMKMFHNDPQVRSRADRWAKAHAPDPDIPLALGIGPYHRDAEYICNLAWARVQITLGQPELAAAAFVQPAIAIARERGLLFRIAELSIAQALIHDHLGNAPAALVALGEALEISEKCGYTRFFNDSPELDRLLLEAIRKKVYSQYTRQLLASFHRPSAKGIELQKKKELSGLVDPLSERELEVLRLLAEGMTPAEVARRLFLSPYTLKAHTQNIYTKLDVHSRIEAINKARHLGLI